MAQPALPRGQVGTAVEALPPFPVKPKNSRMVELVERMLDLHKKLPAAKTAHAKTVLQRQIDAADRQIDQLVYELYGLTEEEIKIVEEESPK